MCYLLWGEPGGVAGSFWRDAVPILFSAHYGATENISRKEKRGKRSYGTKVIEAKVRMAFLLRTPTIDFRLRSSNSASACGSKEGASRRFFLARLKPCPFKTWG